MQSELSSLKYDPLNQQFFTRSPSPGICFSFISALISIAEVGVRGATFEGWMDLQATKSDLISVYLFTVAHKEKHYVVALHNKPS